MRITSGAVNLTAEEAGTTSSTTAGQVVVAMGSNSAVGVQISGTWTGTMSFEGSIDGTNWVAVLLTPPGTSSAVTSATSNGVWEGSHALSYVRVRFSSRGSGTGVVTVRIVPVK